jgi:hypothetical protein
LKFVCILGDSAVGKMTVGQEVSKLTNFSLFHNHMAIELILEVYNDFRLSAIEAIRWAVYNDFIHSDYPGLIVTLQLAFDKPQDIEYLNHLCNFFESHGVTSYVVELDATLDERLRRNRRENRLKHKASKRDVTMSEQRLLNDTYKHRCYSLPGEITHPRFLQIDNTNLSSKDTAQLIVNHFNL